MHASSSYVKILGETNFHAREIPRSGWKVEGGEEEEKRKKKKKKVGENNGQLRLDQWFIFLHIPSWKAMSGFFFNILMNILLRWVITNDHCIDTLVQGTNGLSESVLVPCGSCPILHDLPPWVTLLLLVGLCPFPVFRFDFPYNSLRFWLIYLHQIIFSLSLFRSMFLLISLVYLHVSRCSCVSSSPVL